MGFCLAPLLRANCKWVYQKLDSRFRGNDITLKRFSVMPAQVGIQNNAASELRACFISITLRVLANPHSLYAVYSRPNASRATMPFMISGVPSPISSPTTSRQRCSRGASML